ncbi:hypothetical protein [Streptomyces subrutilus]|uniref:Uncharacterized protein n=1 Tax=Streptomyces subrutilus TaxID=36818 RepID=A0A5P2UHQ9_9ACTN|nr:hypothetical protein [Streptomyces subrutilus]QEU76984.1 hypothetical protein CP968_00425 [Streptomyces subrutilus]WSJ27874.1 hypothetical protein OG479_00435 [Streptomyces subrutilus]
MSRPSLPTTESAVRAVRAVAAEYGRAVAVEEDIGADLTSRRTSAALFTVLDPNGSLPHEAYVELGGVPSVGVRFFPEDDAHVTVEGIEFLDVPRESVPAFLRSVYGGLAWVRGRFFPPGQWLVVPLPGDETYRERVGVALTPWLARIVRG